MKIQKPKAQPKKTAAKKMLHLAEDDRPCPVCVKRMKSDKVEIQERLKGFTDLMQTELAAAKKEKDKLSSTIKELGNRINATQRYFEKGAACRELKFAEAKEKKDAKIKELCDKLNATKKERDEAVERENITHRVNDEALEREYVAIKHKKSALEKLEPLMKEQNDAFSEKEAALERIQIVRKERDDALRKLECFVCLDHQHDLHAFIPCGHMVCSSCKNDNTTDTPCPKCKVAIMAGTPCPKCNVAIVEHLKLYN